MPQEEGEPSRPLPLLVVIGALVSAASGALLLRRAAGRLEEPVG